MAHLYIAVAQVLHPSQKLVVGVDGFLLKLSNESRSGGCTQGPSQYVGIGGEVSFRPSPLHVIANEGTEKTRKADGRELSLRKSEATGSAFNRLHLSTLRLTQNAVANSLLG